MVSKRLSIAVIACLVLLLVAVGAYSYISQINEHERKNSIKTFNFYWEGSVAEYFNTTRFWMNVTFERVSAEASWLDGNSTRINITVKVNDLRKEQLWDSYVGIVSNITGSWKYTVGDWKQKGSLGEYCDGQRFLDILILTMTDSDHEVQYDPDFGFTYVIQSYALELLPTELTDEIHIEYAHKVAVEFCFGMELIT